MIDVAHILRITRTQSRIPHMKKQHLIPPIMASFALAACQSQDDSASAFSLPAPERGFISTQPAANWEENLITGNGTLAISAFSRPLDERIIFNHERLFMPMGAPHVPPDQSEHLPTIRRLIDEGKYKEAEELQFELTGQDGFMYPDYFVPAFDLWIQTENQGETRDYARSVDFQTAEAVVRWSDDQGPFERRMFVSRKDGIAVVKLTAPEGALNTVVKLDPRTLDEGYEPETNHREKSDDVFAEHFGDLKSASGDDWLTFSARFLKSYEGSIEALEGRARVITTGGTATANDDGSLAIAGADSALLFIDLRLLDDAGQSQDAALKAALDALPADYDSLLASHAELHGELFNRMRLDLGGGDDHQKSTEQLMEENSFENINLALLEKQFDAGRFNIICATGELPPNLQGVWGGHYVPAWAGDYTHNGNVPAAIAANHMGNMPELTLAYADYIESIIPGMEHNAQAYFGARGIVLPSRSTTNGYNNALTNNFAGGMWTAGAGWAAHFFFDYYAYTGDEAFLAERALPFMEKVALFYEDFLYEDEETGLLVFSPSTSPENWPEGSDSQASYNSTMDIAVAKQLLENLIYSSEKLGKNADKLPLWKEMLTKMPEYSIADNGIIKEWLTPRLGNNDAHRHSSQLYPLYDDFPEEIADSPELQLAFIKSVEDKLERYWKDNERGFMSFGIVQLGQVAATLGYGEIVHHCMQHLVDGFWLNNLASMHNRRVLFNMDISGGQPSVVIKALADSYPGKVRLFPALPEAWDTGTIEGILCRGVIEINRLHWNGGQVEVELTSGKAQTIDLVLPGDITEVTGEGVAIADGETASERKITLPAGEKVTLKLTYTK